MIYGLYLSASGVTANSHRQDVISNNIANVETIGFRRALASFQERPLEHVEDPSARDRDPRFDRLSGGLFVSPTRLDLSQAPLEQTENPLDLALRGDGFFAVRTADGSTRLTRDGRFLLDREGFVVTADSNQTRLLDVDRNPIQLEGFNAGDLVIDPTGAIRAAGSDVLLATIGVVALPRGGVPLPQGGSLLIPPGGRLPPSDATVHSGYLERSNVDPAVEVVRLMEAQRQLDANANMIRYQDQTLARLVSEVGKIA
jgi:flagellar basal body rod protein FlgG